MSGLPNLPADTPKGLRRFLEKLKETFEIKTAVRGSPLDANPTFRDLIDAGLIKVDPNAPLTANGREFTTATTSWVTSNIPDWVTDNTLPPTPTGLTASLNTAALVLTWDEPVFSNYKQTLIYRASSNNLSSAVVIGSNTGNTYVDDLPPAGTQYFYWIRHESKSELLSDFNDVNGTSITNAPTAPTVSHSFSGDNLVISWTAPTSNLAIQYYIISYGAVAGATIAGVSQSTSFRSKADFLGARTYWVQAVDINFSIGTADSEVVTVSAPGQPSTAIAVTGGSIALSWTCTPGSLPIDHYEIRYGASWAAGTLLGTTADADRIELVVNWTGARTFWVSAYDSAGNISDAGSAVFNPTAPSVTSVTPEVVDNNVLLKWVGSAGTLPIDHYKLYKNTVLQSTTPAQFAVVFESSAGDYTYGLAAIDTAGNEGATTSTTASVAQPPDFILFANDQSDLSGTHTDTFEDARGVLVASNDDAETWATHFTSRGWTTIQDQIDDGYTRYIVGKTASEYRQTVDYGTVIGSAKITLSPTTFFSYGTVTMTPTIEVSDTGAFAGEETTFAGVWSAHSVLFRYVRFIIDFSAAHTGTGLADDTANLLGITPLSFVLDLKLKTYQGMTSCNSADSGGTTVDITDGDFIDVQAITVTPASTSAVIPVYDFVDAPNPTEFKILLFNTSGSRVSGTASWTIRGV